MYIRMGCITQISFWYFNSGVLIDFMMCGRANVRIIEDGGECPEEKNIFKSGM